MITAKTYVEIPGSPSPSPKALQKSEQTCLVGRGCFLDPLSVRTHTERYETEPFSFFVNLFNCRQMFILLTLVLQATIPWGLCSSAHS